MNARSTMLVPAFLAMSLPVLACGDRTGLLLPPAEGPGAPDTGSIAVASDAGASLLPPITVSSPQNASSECPDASSTLVYVVTQQGNLMSFFPPAGAFHLIGHLHCPTSGSTAPFSMAVDRTGLAYVVFDDGELFQVSTATAACRPTGFASAQAGFSTVFGMGFSADTADEGETLYVAGSDFHQDRARCSLATINLRSDGLTVVGAFNPNICDSELTGTGAGDLFGFYAIDSNDAAIGQIDKETARVTGQSDLPGVALGGAWAVAFWGGDFFTFTEPPPLSATVVTRFRPSDGSIAGVAQSDQIVVGAGVSTCAPQQ